MGNRDVEPNLPRRRQLGQPGRPAPWGDEPLTLALITGVLALIPYVGAWLAAVLAALVALLNGPQYPAYTLGLFLVLHLLEGYVLLPLIQRRAVHLPPALTLVAQALMGKMFGGLGLFVAAPLTVATMVLLKMLYVEDTLGDESVDVPGEPGNDRKKEASPRTVPG
jgi:predicted PurR-regulated permease PerM